MPDPLPDKLGIRFREALTWFVQDPTYDQSFLGCTFTARVNSLRLFLEQSPHVAEIEAGLVRWGGQPRVGAISPGARIEFFPGEDGRVAYDLVFHDDVNGFVGLHGEKLLDPA